MTFVIIGCVAGILIYEMVGNSVMKTRMKTQAFFNDVQIACDVDGHTYVVNSPNCNLACQAWVAFAADPDCNFSWSDAAYMKRLTAELFAEIEANRK